MMGKASVTFGLLAVGLLGFAGYRYATDCDPPPGESLVVHEPDRDLGSRPCEEDFAARFRITNASSQPIRVLGLVPG